MLQDEEFDYGRLVRQLQALLAGELDPIANAANTVALIYHALPDINWAGFYFLRGRDLVVGPFQGQPACVRIALGRGVCGVAAETRQTQLVPDVSAFSGHIACDPLSRSEIVVPLLADKKPAGRDLIGVLDIDSPRLARFSEADRKGVEALAAVYVASLAEESVPVSS